MLNHEIIDSLPNESIKVLKDFSNANWIQTECYSDSQLKPLFEHGLIDTENEYIRLTRNGNELCIDWIWDDLDIIPF